MINQSTEAAKVEMAKTKKQMGVQQMLLHPDKETKAVLEYLCKQSGKLYNNGVYFARQTFFKTGKLLTGKFNLVYEPTVGKSKIAQSLPSTPAQQTLLSVAEAFRSYKGLRELWFKGQLPEKPLPPSYLKSNPQAQSQDEGWHQQSGKANCQPLPKIWDWNDCIRLERRI